MTLAINETLKNFINVNKMKKENDDAPEIVIKQLDGKNQSKVLKDQKEAEEYEHEMTESTTMTG